MNITAVTTYAEEYARQHAAAHPQDAAQSTFVAYRHTVALGNGYAPFGDLDTATCNALQIDPPTSDTVKSYLTTPEPLVVSQ